MNFDKNLSAVCSIIQSDKQKINNFINDFVVQFQSEL